MILTLLLMSVASVAISVERWWALRKALRSSRDDLGRLHASLRKRDLDAVAAMADGPGRRGPLAEVLAAGVAEWKSWVEIDTDAGLMAARDAVPRRATLREASSVSQHGARAGPLSAHRRPRAEDVT